ncbi:NAD-dependent epimerase/dehydratase family protein [Longirhabdus pacifica]|uniref:NAD-dependent epimerase/dehydratase family protein n=1 Tax=Longirhabdus pacifica TaxID=2305227 RepID=UPI00197D0182|nr:NAD-dependent epimerase/dehydratase family protein [Longirhabdus pacifica]
MKFEHVLVTGGAGFIGSQLISALLPLASHIHVIDDLSTGRIEHIPKAEHITFYHDSINNDILLEKILPNIQYIFHLACRNLILSADDLMQDFQTNLLGTMTLLNKVKTHGHQVKKIMYTSTASVYGDADILPTPETYHQIKLPYPASKFSAEHYCHVYYHMYQLPISILRLSNVYGRGQVKENPYCGVVTKFFEAAMNNNPIIIYGDGNQTRDFTYIDDAIQAILLTAKHHVHGQVYNVGTGVETSINTLADSITTLLGHENGERINKEKRVVDTVNRRVMDVRYIEKEINWRAKYNLSEGLHHTLEWIKHV